MEPLNTSENEEKFRVDLDKQRDKMENWSTKRLRKDVSGDSSDRGQSQVISKDDRDM